MFGTKCEEVLKPDPVREVPSSKGEETLRADVLQPDPNTWSVRIDESSSGKYVKVLETVVSEFQNRGVDRYMAPILHADSDIKSRMLTILFNHNKEASAAAYAKLAEFCQGLPNSDAEPVVLMSSFSGNERITVEVKSGSVVFRLIE